MVDIPLLTGVLPPSQEDMNHLPSIKFEKGDTLAVSFGECKLAEKVLMMLGKVRKGFQAHLVCFSPSNQPMVTLQGTNISPQNGILKMIFLFPRCDMLISWRVIVDLGPGGLDS